jgi:uncharacterized protein (DUF1778 family)
MNYMATLAPRKDHPLSMRLPETDIAMIDRAAALQGRSRTDFIRHAARHAAEEAILESRLITTSPEGFREFLDVISAPAKPIPTLIEALRRKAPWE